MVLVLCFGLWWGGHPAQLPGFLRSVFVANPHDVVLSETLSDIQHDYFRPISRQGLIKGSITGAIASLGDPYAGYETPSQYSAFNNPKDQSFSGVGIDVLGSKAGLIVENVLPSTPAARATRPTATSTRRPSGWAR